MRYACGLLLLLTVPGLASADDPDGRLAALNERIARAPSDVELLLQRAELSVQERDLTQAAMDLRLVESLAPDHPQLALLRGLVSFDRGRLAAAESDLEAYVGRTGGTLRACFVLGQVYEHRDREGDALRLYDMALGFGDDVDVYLAKGRLLEGLGRLDEAASTYETALQAATTSIVLRARLIEVEQRLGRFDRALAHIDAAARHARVDTRWLLRRAEVLEAAGRPGEAERARAAALAEAERDLAQALRRAPRLTEARALLARARRLAGGSR